MKWTDVFEIAMSLDEAYPAHDPLSVNFVDLRNWIVQLPGFADDSGRCNEKILEAIQQAWIEERRE